MAVIKINKTQRKHLMAILEQTTVISAYHKIQERKEGKYDLEPNELLFLITVIEQYADQLETLSKQAILRAKNELELAYNQT